MDKIVIEGIDNYGKPKQDFADRIASWSDEKLENEAETIIWLSAYAANNYRSDYHWQVQAIYNECSRRNKASIYTRAFEKAKACC